MPRPDGGPAFPSKVISHMQVASGLPDRPSHAEAVTFPTPGMSLRDWFAGQALAGILAFPGAVNGNRDKSGNSVVSAAYAYADAMIAERAKP